MIIASNNPFMNLYGFFLTTMKYISGKTSNEWMPIAETTVTMKRPRLLNVPSMFAISANFADTKLQIPIGEYLRKNSENVLESLANVGAYTMLSA